MNKSLSSMPTDYTDPENDRRKESSGVPNNFDAGRRHGDNFTYISFYVNNQLLGIPIEKVQEVIVPQNICKVPLAHESVSGLLNLRGQIVTAIDLRKRLQLPPSENQETHINIVVRDNDELFALIADSVGEVMELRKDTYETTPVTLDSCWKQCCGGVHKLKKGLIIILKVQLLLQFCESNKKDDTNKILKGE